MARRRARPRKRSSGSRRLLVVVAVAGFALGYGVATWRSRSAGAPAPSPLAQPQAPVAERPYEEPPPAEPESRIPLPEPPAEGRYHAGNGARVALVIDDLGRRVQDVADFAALAVPLSYGVLPFESHTAQVVRALRERRAEVLCHLPMEPRNGANPGPGALTGKMTRAELEQGTRWALAAVEGASGVNNHMGSSLSADRRSMRAILEVVRGERLFYLDSRTTADSVAYDTAREMGVPAARRQVFLDGDVAPDAIREQFARLLELARRNGSAIAIGHPHPGTLEVLAAEVPRARRAGYEFVPVSYLVDRAPGIG